MSAMELRPMLRRVGVEGNGNGPLEEIRLPDHIETSMLDGTILPTTQGIKFIRSSRSSKRGSSRVGSQYGGTLR